MSTVQDPFRAPDYAVARRRMVSRDPVVWPREITTGIVVAVFAALLGALVGVVWHAVAPHLDVVAAINNPQTKTKSLIGQDLWLGLLGILAGIVCVALLRLVANQQADGPGAQIGLAVGGLLGMIVADRVGHLIGHHAFDASVASAVRSIIPNATDKGVQYVTGLFELKVRAKAVLFSWPIVAVALNVLVMGVRRPNESAPRYAPAYPGSS